MRLIFLIVLALGMIVPGIASLPPLDRDESRYVQATKQMVESGNYVDIRFQEESRYKKPIGIYWLQSLAVRAGGKGVDAPLWHYRLVSVAAILLAVSAIFLTGTAMFGPLAGLVAALALMAMFGVALEGRIAKTDAMLLAFALIAQAALAQVHSAARRKESLWPGHAWIFWGAQGIAILLKGPIVPLLSLLTVAVLWLFERDGTWLKQLRPVRGAMLSILIAAPWLIAITWESGGAFWSESVGADMMGKVTRGQESHGAPPGYYLLSYAVYVWPLGPPLLAASLALLGRMRADPPLLFLFAWYMPYWLLCELIPTKLPHYMLPAYPALALALGWAIANMGKVSAPAQPLWQKWLYRFAVTGQVLVTLALAAIAVGAPIYLASGASIGGLLAALALVSAGWLGLRHAASARGLAATAVAAVIAYGLLFAIVAPSLERVWLTPRIVAAIEAAKPCPDTLLAASGFHEPSLVFLAGTTTRLTDLDSVARHLKADPACAVALVAMGDADRLAALLRQDGRTVALLAEITGINYSNGKALALGLYAMGSSATDRGEGN